MNSEVSYDQRVYSKTPLFRRGVHDRVNAYPAKLFIEKICGTIQSVFEVFFGG